MGPPSTFVSRHRAWLISHIVSKSAVKVGVGIADCWRVVVVIVVVLLGSCFVILFLGLNVSPLWLNRWGSIGICSISYWRYVIADFIWPGPWYGYNTRRKLSGCKGYKYGARVKVKSWAVGQCFSCGIPNEGLRWIDTGE